MALSVGRAVSSAEKCEANGAQRWSGGALALGPLQVWEDFNLRTLSVGLDAKH